MMKEILLITILLLGYANADINITEEAKKACDKGNATGCSNLGAMNDNAQGVKQDNVKVKYINFIPKNIDKTCLDHKIETLFNVLLSVKKAKEMERKIPSKEYFSKKYEKQRKEIKELSSQLLRKKHISYKGNHEWRKLIASKYILIEDKERKFYIMYPLKPSSFIMSGIPFKTLNEGQGIQTRGMKNWIDIRKCFKSSQE